MKITRVVGWLLVVGMYSYTATAANCFYLCEAKALLAALEDEALWNEQHAESSISGDFDPHAMIAIDPESGFLKASPQIQLQELNKELERGRWLYDEALLDRLFEEGADPMYEYGGKPLVQRALCAKKPWLSQKIIERWFKSFPRDLERWKNHVNKPGGHFKRTALHFFVLNAASFSEEEFRAVLKSLIKAGADPGAVDAEGFNPLQLAFFKRSHGVAHLLKEVWQGAYVKQAWK